MSREVEFRIVSLKLTNYRQYYQQQEALFSRREEGFSIFLGENGEGKSNLLNAINWCFFHKEPHLGKSKGLPIINTKYLEELPNGSVAEMRVSVELERGEDKYRITRVLKGIKHELKKEKFGDEEYFILDKTLTDPLPVGFEVINEENSFSVSYHGGTFEDKSELFRGEMNKLLPEKLAHFYLLDGEFLAKVFENFEEVEQGVEKVSQLELISNAMKHMFEFSSNISPGRGEDVDEISKTINTLLNYQNSSDPKGNFMYSKEIRYKLSDDEEDTYHPSSGYPRITSLKEDIKKIKKRIGIISEELRTNSPATIKSLEGQERILDQSIETDKTNLNEIRKTYLDSLIKFGSAVFLKEAIQHSKQLIANEIELGRLPNKITIIFTEQLLEKGECFCGANLNGDSNPHRIKILEKQKQAQGDSRLDAAVELRYDYESLLKGYRLNLIKMDDYHKKISGYEYNLKRLLGQKKIISEQIKNSGDKNSAQLITEQEYLTSLISSQLSTEIVQINNEMNSYTEQIKENRRQLIKIGKKNEKVRRLTHELEIWQRTHEQLGKILKTLQQTIRLEVQKKTSEFFRQIVWKKDFDKVAIDENYNLKVFKQHYNAINELSAGEKMFLALSFIAAIRDITGYKFPLVIDTPLGRISGTPRIKVAQKISEFLPNSQLVLLTTDTEYISPIVDIDDPYSGGKSFREYLRETIQTKEYRLKMDKSSHTTKIVPYAPRSVVLLKEVI